MLRAGEHAAGVKGHVALEEVVERIAVEQRGRADQDQAFVLVGDVDIGVQRMDGLLAVFRAMLCARRIGGDRRRRGDAAAYCVGT